MIETGPRLIAAKGELPHGQFEAMVEQDLPLGPRTAQRLRAVADDDELVNPTHGSLLPASWRKLYELSRLPPARFHELIEDGTIHPEMRRKDVSGENRRLR